MRPTQQMNMIIIHTHPFYLDLISFLYTNRRFLDDCNNFLI